MSAPQGNDNGGGQNPLPNIAALSVSNNMTDAQRRLAIAQAARENATREEIEARGIRPDVNQILHHMNETPSHSFKRARLTNSTPRRIYDSDEDEDGDEDDDDDVVNHTLSPRSEEKKDDEEWQKILAEQGLQDANSFLVAEFRQLARQRIRMLKQGTAEWDALHHPPKTKRTNLIRKLSKQTEFIVEVCKHLRPIDIVNLYSVSRDFHHTLNENMRSSVFAWTRVMAPSSARIYSSPVYCRWFIPDPAGRTVTSDDQIHSQTQKGQAKIDGQPTFNLKEGEVRLIPGLLWLQMVANREIRVRDIIATLARMGHRLPKGAHLTLKKIWLTMDAATTQARMILMNNPDFFTNEDLYIAQLFMVKLVLAFNDPVFGPQSTMLMRLMMGQRGLSPLWAFLRGKKYRSAEEMRQMKLRYDVGPDQAGAQDGMPFHGVEVDELGVIHYEGWGTGRDHLMRPDELVPLEAVRRQLDLDNCIEEMLIYGHVDLNTGNNLVPSLEEMYMSDDDLSPALRDWTPLQYELINGGCGNVPFSSTMWQPKHARKARWKTLTDEEKTMILAQEQAEINQLKQFEGVHHKFQLTAAKLTRLVYPLARRRQQTGGKFVLAPPTAEELAQALANNSLTTTTITLSSSSSSTYSSDDDNDAMDIDPNPEISQTPRRNRLSDSDSDLDLTLDPISRSELEGIYASYRRPHRPQSETESERPMLSSGDEDEDEDEDGEDDEADDEGGSEEGGDGEEGEDEFPRGLIIPRHPPAVPAVELFTPATSVGTDDMLLAQADMEYSDEEGDGDDEGDDYEGEEAEGMVMDVVEGVSAAAAAAGGAVGVADDAASTTVAATGGEGDGMMDWDDFLRNPAAYAVEEEVDDGDEEEDVQQDGAGGGDEGGNGDGDGNGANMQQDGGGQDNQAVQQGLVVPEEGENEWAQYMVEEDIGEDPRTRMLRDWFRPW